MGEEKKNPVLEGMDVTLHTSTQLHKDDVIQWCYVNEEDLIAKFDTVKTEKHVYNGADGRFRSKLSLDDTGNLTISDIKTIHSGHYKLKISSRKRTKSKTILVPVTVKSESVEKGESFPLETDAKTEGNLILWTFGAEKRLIVKFDSGACYIGEKFRDRLERDDEDETGSVTIINMDTKDSGQYKLQIINSEQTIIKRINVSVTESTKKSVNESTPLMSEERV
ncbi:uncharacterized protein LOC113092174 [Carassius auratus]|uniref:Uncharacterized protein LOC113092174 n=1 Tax=Carassius auratus TaxID=7957 RepID=A0A6P6NYL8_CARAU|nr:uncharacterized protein LOC113092174 [Carassius auratus]